MSQPDTITLATAITNTATLTNEVFREYDRTSSKTTYNSSGHTTVKRDQLALYRTPAKRNGNFLGSTKTATKFTMDIEVPNADGSGNIVVPLIADLSYSVPVGATPAQTEHIRQRIVALADRTDLMANLVDNGEI